MTTATHKKAPKAAKSQKSLESAVYAPTGKHAGSVKLPETIFGLPWNADLVHQVVTAMRGNARIQSAHTKDRSEVSGGGKKPWRQKGTGRARHGSSRSPIWRHGGVTHGPRNEKDYTRKVNRKMRTKALFVALSKRYADGDVIFLSDLGLKEPKTKDARAVLGSLGNITEHKGADARRKNAFYVVLPKEDAVAKKSFRNMGNVLVGTAATLNPVDALSYKRLLVVAPDVCIQAIEARNK